MERSSLERPDSAELRDLIIAERAHPSVIVSRRLPLSDAPDAFRRFDQRADGYIRVELDPTDSGT